ncbi:GNAT family N-acetyltransferase [Paenibacillus pini]|uniref:N-acetyltransferase n=1 Tax=Paenibacillus pini JCM 16418 TaxID=1236976 RepID=W7YGE1_9BACL|nr:GNAT family N-acetyltransferase [Paenibacillus pini]GAF06598.1 N-acetyltransferase [Paenibacillus pini JCM 16418]
MNDGEIYLRWANTDDAADLVVFNDAFNGVGLSIEEVQDNIAVTSELIALAVMDDLIVGFACAQYFKSFCYRGLQGEITELYITEAARGKGLGTLLISFLEEELSARGVTSVKVLTGNTNENAIKTYEKSRYSKMEKELLLQKKLEPIR